LKRVLLLIALVALGALGLILAQVGSAEEGGCDDTVTTVATVTTVTTVFTETFDQVSLLQLQAPAGLTPNSCKTPLPPPYVNPPDGIFLCYSTSQVEPGVWLQDQAAELLAAGYYYPKALPGNVDGGTNLGSFHLVCNASGTPTGMFVNENGEVIPPEHAQGNLGYYPQLS
jgi:hypothetical protein